MGDLPQPENDVLSESLTSKIRTTSEVGDSSIKSVHSQTSQSTYKKRLLHELQNGQQQSSLIKETLAELSDSSITESKPIKQKKLMFKDEMHTHDDIQLPHENGGFTNSNETKDSSSADSLTTTLSPFNSFKSVLDRTMTGSLAATTIGTAETDVSIVQNEYIVEQMQSSSLKHLYFPTNRETTPAAPTETSFGKAKL